MRIYGDITSGNCLKVKYVADHLGLPYVWTAIDVTRGESRTSTFLEKSAMGQVPIVEFDDGRVLAQSNAIMRHLAQGSPLLPADLWLQAKVDEWLFWEQNAHEFFVAGCRYQMVYLGRSKAEREPFRVERGEQALNLMERALAGKEFFLGDAMTIADIGLLAYTRLAGEGGFDLSPRANVIAWIARCEQALGLPSLH
jgi:glutathione S-transferase